MLHIRHCDLIVEPELLILAPILIASAHRLPTQHLQLANFTLQDATKSLSPAVKTGCPVTGFSCQTRDQLVAMLLKPSSLVCGPAPAELDTHTFCH
jgi:hypothetical protein